MMTLRTFRESDLALFCRWLKKPHVARWYTPMEDWLYEVSHREEFPFLTHFIAEIDGNPMGFCQYYDYEKGGEQWHGSRVLNGTYSIDYLIGEEDCLHRHFSSPMLSLLEQQLPKEAKELIVRPEPENLISRKALLSAGYTYEASQDIFVRSLQKQNK